MASMCQRIVSQVEVQPRIAALGQHSPAWGLLGTCFGANGPESTLVEKRSMIGARARSFNQTCELGVGGSVNSDALRQLSIALSSTPASFNFQSTYSPTTSLLNTFEYSQARSSPSKSARWFSEAVHPAQDYKISNIRKLADSCVEVTLVPADGGSPNAEFSPGQCLELQLVGKPSRRYVVTSPPGQRYLQCCIKADRGEHDSMIKESLKLGSAIRVAAPSGRNDVQQRPIVLISAGIGSAVTKAFLESIPEHVKMMVHVDRDQKSHAFRREMRRSNIDALFHYTSEDGRPSTDMLMKKVEALVSCADFIIAGPPSFLDSVHFALDEAGAKHVLRADRGFSKRFEQSE